MCSIEMTDAIKQATDLAYADFLKNCAIFSINWERVRHLLEASIILKLVAKISIWVFCFINGCGEGLLKAASKQSRCSKLCQTTVGGFPHLMTNKCHTCEISMRASNLGIPITLSFPKTTGKTDARKSSRCSNEGSPSSRKNV